MRKVILVLRTLLTLSEKRSMICFATICNPITRVQETSKGIVMTKKKSATLNGGAILMDFDFYILAFCLFLVCFFLLLYLISYFFVCFYAFIFGISLFLFVFICFCILYFNCFCLFLCLLKNMLVNLIHTTVHRCFSLTAVCFLFPLLFSCVPPPSMILLVDIFHDVFFGQ